MRQTLIAVVASCVLAGPALGENYPTVSEPLHFYAVRPCRVLDSREEGSKIVYPRRMLAFDWSCPVPAETAAVLVTLQVVDPDSAGHLQAYALNATGGEPTGTSVLAWEGPRETRAVQTMVWLGSDPGGYLEGSFTLRLSTPAHLVVDVVGFYAP